MTLTVETDLRAVIVADAEAIERAMHKRQLRNLGLCTDDQVQCAIAEVRAEAAERSLTVAALMAGDYDDNDRAHRRRMHAALWRSCQIHHAEGEYPALTRAAAIENGGNR